MTAAQGPDVYGELWAPVYDDEHRFLDPTPAVTALADLAGPLPALELGVGTGRVALPLARAGVDIRGIDASPAMVEQLRSKPGGEALPVVIGDMASTPLGGPYGLVFVVFNTLFGLLDQQRQLDCFANVARSLPPGGQFVLECFVPDLVRYRDGGQSTRAITVDDTSVRLNVSTLDPVEQTIRTQMIGIGGNAITTRPVALRYAWPAELDLMARLAGLELSERWSNWSRAAFDRHAPQHISIYRKP